jgi:hypothetical protein
MSFAVTLTVECGLDVAPPDACMTCGLGPIVSYSVTWRMLSAQGYGWHAVVRCKLVHKRSVRPRVRGSEDLDPLVLHAFFFAIFVF